MKKYTTYRNSNGSYTTYEEDVAPGTNMIPFFIGIIAVYFLLPFSPILFFVTKFWIKNHKNHPKVKWVKIANIVTLVVFILQITVWIALISILIAHFSNIIYIPLIAQLFS